MGWRGGGLVRLVELVKLVLLVGLVGRRGILLTTY